MRSWFENRVYDLSWDRPFRESMIIVIIALCIPYSIKYPVAAAYCVGATVSYSFIMPRINRLGLTHNFRVRRILMIMFIMYMFLNVFMFVFIQEIKFEAHMANSSDTAAIFSLENDPFKEWDPDYRFGEAVLTGSVSLSLLLCWKRLILLGIIAPVYESIFIFAILFPALWNRYSYRQALLVTIALFLLIHFPTLGIMAFFEYSIFVLISIIMYVKTKSLLPLIMFHALTNVTKLAIGVYLNWELQTVYTNLLR